MRNLVFFVCVCIVLGMGAVIADDQLPTIDVIPTTTGSIEIRPIEHATFLMVWNDMTIAVDPVGGAEAFDGLPRADIILVTDIHGDHLSPETIAAAGTESATIIAPAAVAERIPESDRERVTVLANGTSTTWRRLTIEAIPMYNLDAERQKFHTKGRGNGYVVTDGATRVYISGDTEDIPEMRALENIDVAFVCMNLPYTMDVGAAAEAVLEFAPKIVYPYHFRGTDGMSDLDDFTALVAGNPAIDVRVLAWY